MNNRAVGIHENPSNWPIMARMTAPQSDVGVRIVVLADPHLTPTEEGTWKLFHRTEERLKTAVDDVASGIVGDVDLIVFAGDLTRDGELAEFDRFDEIVADLGVPAVAIPGNHDVPKSFDNHGSPTAEEFAVRYGVDGFPFVRHVGDMSIVGLNSSSTPDGVLQDTWGGIVSAEQLDWLEEQLPDLDDPIVFVHHNLAAQPEHVDAYPWNRFPMRKPERLLQILEAADVPLVVSGHHHLPSVNDFRTPTDGTGPDGSAMPGAGPIEVMAPAICSFPQAYLLLEINKTGTTVRFVPLADREGNAEAWRAASAGKALGVGTVAMAEERLSSFPLIDELERDDCGDVEADTGDVEADTGDVEDDGGHVEEYGGDVEVDDG